MRKYPISEMAKARYTKEELAEAEAKVGTWVYQWTKVVPEGTDWKSQMLSYGMDADQITLVSAVPAQEAVMGVCVRDGQLTDVVSLSDAMFEVEGEGVEAFGLDDDGVATVQIGDIFSYEQAQDCFGRLELKPGAGDGLIGSRPVYQMVSEPQTNGKYKKRREIHEKNKGFFVASSGWPSVRSPLYHLLDEWRRTDCV